MSRTRQVLWASALSGAGVFVSMAAVLVIQKLATRTLSTADFGVFVLIQFWADALNLFTNLGFSASLPRVVAAAPEADRNRTTAAALTGAALLSLSVSLIALLAWYFGAGALGSRVGEDDRHFLAFAWLVPPLFFVGVQRDTVLAALAGFHRFSHRAVSIVLASVLSMAIAGLCVATGHVSVASFSGALALGHGVNLLWLYFALPRGARWRWDPASFLDTARASTALYQNSLLNFVSQRVDVLISQRLLGLQIVSLLGVVKYFPTVFSRVMGALQVPLLPNLAALIAQGDHATAARVMNRALLLSATLGYTAVLASAALARPLILVFTDAKYLPAAPALGWLMAAMCLAVQAGIPGQALIALGRPGIVTRVNAATAVLAAGLNWVLLPRFGLLGAGYAATLSMALSALVQAAAADRLGLTLDRRHFVLLQLLFALCCGGFWLCPEPFRLAAALAFPLLLVITGAFPWTEVRAVTGVLSARFRRPRHNI